MAKFDFEMIVTWAKVFKENADMGDPQASPKTAAGAIGRKGGEYQVNCYFTKEEDLQAMIDAGMDLKPMGYDRVIEDGEYGIGKYIKAKRNVADNIKTFKGRGNTEVTVNYGGPIKVIDFTDPENKKPWVYEEDGPIGNGSKCIVRLDMHSEGAGIRIEAIAVKELVAYEPSVNSEYADVWDD